MKIISEHADPVVNLCLDTLKKRKQALIFVSTKRNAEAMAERISEVLKTSKELELSSEQIIKVLASPTKQCLRLAKCVKKGSAFHHAGLAHKQRTLIENKFKEGLINFIVSTPTLALGINLPAYRVIIRDLKRFTRRGLNFIPVLEYHQMCGRAGRPDFNDKHGEALTLAKTKSQLENIKEVFIKGEPEKIYSKLAVEPVFRTYVLSLIVSRMATKTKFLENFFSDSFYALQYGDTTKINSLISSTIGQLTDWGFLKGKSDFVSATSLTTERLDSSRLGTRVSELYLDPYTANFLIENMNTFKKKISDDFSFLQMFASTLEMRPLSTVRKAEEDDLIDLTHDLLIPEPSFYDPDYDDFLKSIKTAKFLEYWINEYSEKHILETFNISPGEISAKLNVIDWLIYSAQELARILGLNQSIKRLKRLRMRLKYGVKEELLPLLKLKNIGRVRARKLFMNGIKSIFDIKKTDFIMLKRILGEKMALNVKKQVGQEIKFDKGLDAFQTK